MDFLSIELIWVKISGIRGFRSLENCGSDLESLAGEEKKKESLAGMDGEAGGHSGRVSEVGQLKQDFLVGSCLD